MVFKKLVCMHAPGAVLWGQQLPSIGKGSGLDAESWQPLCQGGRAVAWQQVAQVLCLTEGCVISIEMQAGVLFM